MADSHSTASAKSATSAEEMHFNIANLYAASIDRAVEADGSGS